MNIYSCLFIRILSYKYSYVKTTVQRTITFPQLPLITSITGAQIDLLIARKDRVINLCEAKYSQSEYLVTKKDDENIRRKISVFTQTTGTKDAIFPILITNVGVIDNSYAMNFQSVIISDDLFTE